MARLLRSILAGFRPHGLPMRNLIKYGTGPAADASLRSEPGPWRARVMREKTTGPGGFRRGLVASAALSMMLGAFSCSSEDPANYKPSLVRAAALDSYYAGASDAAGGDLLQKLNRIVTKGANVAGYSKAWDIIMDVDTDPDDSGNVILFYTGESRSKKHRVGGSSGKSVPKWNREHVWPKSKGPDDYGSSGGHNPASDVHNLWPTDDLLNNMRGNLDFDEGGDPVPHAPDTFSDRDSFEPRDDFKGEVARVLFYMAVKYPRLQLSETVDGGSFSLGRLCKLLDWNEFDAVSDFERSRNDRIYDRWQHNRNPFVDHPEWARIIWGSRC